MTFQWPLALIALVLVPVVIALYVLRERRRDDYAARFTTPTPAAEPRRPPRPAGADIFRSHCCSSRLAALVVGVARPHASVERPARGGDRDHRASTLPCR